jgi:hypothetical protein
MYIEQAKTGQLAPGGVFVDMVDRERAYIVFFSESAVSRILNTFLSS